MDPGADTQNTAKRANLAGVGAGAALVAGAVVVFLGVAAFVAFNGLPFGAQDSADANVALATAAPEAAAAAAAATASAVAPDPVPPTPAAAAEIVAALPPGTVPEGPGASAGDPGFDGGDDPTDPDGGDVPPPIIPPAEPGPAGALGNAVGGLEHTAGGLGLNLPLTDLTKGLTAPLDKTVNNALNGVGGALGDRRLGDKVIGTVNRTVDNLLGPGGLTDSLLGP